jgi:hypothetical protein
MSERDGTVTTVETHDKPLELGWMRVCRQEPNERFPVRVTILAGFMWTDPDDLLRAARLLSEAADWLEDQRTLGQHSLFGVDHHGGAA